MSDDTRDDEHEDERDEEPRTIPPADAPAGQADAPRPPDEVTGVEAVTRAWTEHAHDEVSGVGAVRARQADDEGVIEGGGAPSFFPPDATFGTEEDLDALLPSLRPGRAPAEDRGAASEEPSGVMRVLGATPERDESGELLLSTSVARRPMSERPSGLLSSVLVQERPPPVDEGALVALRNLPRRARGLRRPTPPSSAPGAEHPRVALLMHLAAGAEGRRRARLLCAAAEIYGAAGMPQRAESIHETAHEADPSDPVALAALQRAALALHDDEKLRALLRLELDLALPDRERASLWTRIALVDLSHGQEADAHAALAEATRLAPAAKLPVLLLARSHLAQGRVLDAAEALERVAQAWPDSAGKAAISTQSARLFAKAGEHARARDTVGAALRADASSVDASLTSYRLAREAGATGDALDALERLGRAFETPALRAELSRTYARLALGLGRDPRKALARLDAVTSTPALRTRWRAAEALGAREAIGAALEAWAAGAPEGERALAWLELAEHHAATGAAERAEAALDAAARADSGLTLVAVLRERIARAAADAGTIARSIAPGPNLDPVEAAGRLASRRGATKEEREVLAAARASSAAPAIAAIAVDVAAEAGAWPEVVDDLRRAAERLDAGARAGALLALAMVERRAPGSPGDARASMDAAERAAPTAPHVLAERRARATDPAERAGPWLDLARTAAGARAAFAAMISHACARRAGQDGAEALARALDMMPRGLPALWARERVIRAGAMGAASDLVDLDRTLAEASVDPGERAARLLRIALAHRAIDAPEAMLAAERALAERPTDVTLDALVVELRGAPAERRAEHLERAAASAPPVLARALHLEAAACYEDAGEHGRAAALYHGALDTSEGADPHARTGIERALPRTGLHVLLSERRESALRAAPDEASRALSLERLARMRETSGDAPHARAAWRDLAALRRGHRGALRALERAAMQNHDDADLLEHARQWLRELTARGDRRGYLSLACHLTRTARDAGPDACDEIVTATFGRDPDLWLALQLEAAALRASDVPRTVEARRAIAARLVDPIERACIELRIAEALDERVPAEALAALREVADAPHPLAIEELARLAGIAGEHRDAAEAYERAARLAASTERRVRLWHRAGSLWQTELGEPERAIAAFREVLDLEPDHRDAFARAKRLLEANDDAVGMLALVEQRAKARLDPETTVALHVERAALYKRIGDPRRAREALALALALAPERTDLSAELARLYVAAGQHHEAAEMLVRLARTTQDPALLHETFLSLGEIYDEHLPDARRAEIALTRAAALVPNDTRALDRLANVLRKDGQAQKALRVLVHLYEVAQDVPEIAERCILKIADISDELGLPKDAERALEAHRRRNPTHADVVRALADRYAAQGDTRALAVHLDRSAVSLRAELEAKPRGTQAWRTLTEVLRRRDRTDAAHAVEALAGVLGIDGFARPAVLAALGADALGPGATSRAIPAKLDAVAMSFLRALDAVVDGALPLPPGTLDGESYADPPPALGEAFGRVAKWLGRRTRLHTTTGSRCFASAADPLVLAVGPELVEHAGTDELTFLLMRAAALARLELGVPGRRDPEELERALRALAAALAPAAHAEVPEPLRELGERLLAPLEPAVHLPLRERAHALAAVGVDVGGFGVLALEAGSRVALAATGDLAAALTALQLASHPEALPDPFDAIEQLPEARALFAHALEEACTIGARETRT